MGTSAGIMFLDVKGYSKLEYQGLKDFHTNICQALSEIIKKCEQDEPYIYRKTWGDGIVLAHYDLYKLSRVALDIRDYFNNRKYEENSDGALNGKELRCRIAIHYADFEAVKDPIDGSQSCFGKGIILPARIEPITESGHVWATTTATRLIWQKQNNYDQSQVSWIYKGKIPLAKEFGLNDVWEILRVGGKDDNDHEGTQEEPTIPQNANTSAPLPESEEYHPLTKTEAIRIQALTGKDPQAENISICSRDRSVDKCPGKGRSILAISEMERNSQSATEETQVAYWIHEIHKSSKRIVDFFNGAEKDLQYTHIYDLKENITKLFKCFDEFERDNTWPDYYDWPASFLIWRIKEELGANKSEETVKGVFVFAKTFQQFIEEKYINPNDSPNFKPSDINIKIQECIRHLCDYTENLNIQIGPLSKKRLCTVKTITRKVFNIFDRFRFAQHLENLTNDLASINKVAEVWAK